MDLTQIQDLIKFVSKSGTSEVELETKEFKITIKTPVKRKPGDVEPQIIQATLPYQATMQPMQQMQAAAPSQQPAVSDAVESKTDSKKAPEADSKYITIKSPMIGTFYRSASPDKPAFVGIGDEISEGSTICIIEAMKLFNEIESEVSGKIVKVLAEDATPVEYDQPLFLVDPS